MSVTREDLMAYADGELDAAETARVEAAIADNADLLAVVESHRAMRSRLSVAYASVIDEAVPARLLDAARAKPVVDNVVALGASHAKRMTRPWQAGEWAAMAAAVLVGVLIGGQTPRPESAIFAANEGLEARGALARALETQLVADEGAVKIGLTFRSQSGDACRTFATNGGALNGLACRSDGIWRVDSTSRGEARPKTQFRTASADVPPVILARVEMLIVGDPMDMTQEKAARDQRWRSPD